jgi:hypothetical protein
MKFIQEFPDFRLKTSASFFAFSVMKKIDKNKQDKS